MMQLMPLPVNPGLQTQLNEPAELVHEALVWQLCERVVHSSKSSPQFGPLHPLLQRQRKEARRRGKRNMAALRVALWWWVLRF
jgi:hypothetical protein